MNPGLVVKLRPTGPWRIGPDSGARNKVDAVYHSDSLYAAVTSAMARLGSLEEWLDATARGTAPAVSFGSCFPFVDEIGFVTPPRTVWPPTSPALLSSRVRWKSARFVPVGVVQSILAGERLDDNKWAVDGPSGCLLPTGKRGPFRMSLRGNAAVDRLTGVAERHSIACLEFRPGAGLWTVVSFADQSARDRWMPLVQAAFRWLADSGFGGERSRGWGRSESPEFTEGSLPQLIWGMAPKRRAPKPPKAAAPVEEPTPVPPVEEPPAEEPPVTEPPAPEPEPAPPVEPPAEEPEPEPLEEASQREKPDIAGFSAASDDDTDDKTPEPASPTDTPTDASTADSTDAPSAAPTDVSANAPADTSTDAPAQEPIDASSDASAAEPTDVSTDAPPAEPTEASTHSDASTAALNHEPTPNPSRDREGVVGPRSDEPAQHADSVTPPTPNPETPTAPEQSTQEPAPGPRPPAPAGTPYWLLSLYTPAPADTVDWTRGNYTLLHRGGRVDTSGELKKQLAMVSEGSVVYASTAPVGSAPDVAPDGAPHPVFRAGFAIAIPLGEVG
jgi:CRISPR type III-A-associated RAMP protein Csm4